MSTSACDCSGVRTIATRVASNASDPGSSKMLRMFGAQWIVLCCRRSEEGVADCTKTGRQVRESEIDTHQK